jgi:hypothetical protein
VVDHQAVNLEMDDKSVISLTMSAFTGDISRHLKVMGTLGEINADMDTNLIKTQIFGFKPEITDITALEADLSGHGGGDFRMIDKLLELLAGKGSSLTSLDNSVESHLACFAAEYSRTHDGISVPIKNVVELYN